MCIRDRSGTLQQPEAMGVSQSLKDKGYALLCVAKATSDLEVETTFEDEVYDLQFGQYFGRGNTRVAQPWEFEEDFVNLPDSSAFIDMLGVFSNKYSFILFSTSKSTLVTRSPFLPFDDIF